MPSNPQTRVPGRAECARRATVKSGANIKMFSHEHRWSAQHVRPCSCDRCMLYGVCTCKLGAGCCFTKPCISSLHSTHGYMSGILNWQCTPLQSKDGWPHCKLKPISSPICQSTQILQLFPHTKGRHLGTLYKRVICDPIRHVF